MVTQVEVREYDDIGLKEDGFPNANVTPDITMSADGRTSSNFYIMADTAKRTDSNEFIQDYITGQLYLGRKNTTFADAVSP
jgi:hypothetical protein